MNENSYFDDLPRYALPALQAAWDLAHGRQFGTNSIYKIFTRDMDEINVTPPSKPELSAWIERVQAGLIERPGRPLEETADDDADQTGVEIGQPDTDAPIAAAPEIAQPDRIDTGEAGEISDIAGIQIPQPATEAWPDTPRLDGEALKLRALAISASMYTLTSEGIRHAAILREAAFEDARTAAATLAEDLVAQARATAVAMMVTALRQAADDLEATGA